VKLLPNDSGWGKCSFQRRAAAWRMANVDDLRTLHYDSGAITRGRHARRLHYKIIRANGFNLGFLRSVAAAVMVMVCGHRGISPSPDS